MRRPSAFVLLAVLLVAHPASAGSDPLRPRQWGLGKTGAAQAWSAGQGAGIAIAVVDTGVDLGHEDLVDRLLPGRDFVDGDDHPQDRHGHGTHVAGIAAATAGNGRGIAGVAPAARILPVRVLDEEGRGSSRAVADGIRWAVDRGARVVNLSLGDLGQPLFGPAFGEAIQYAWSRGAVPVVSAGNDFLLSSGYAEQNALVVSATDRNDRKPAYSSGVGQAKWGMAAPGGAGRPTGRGEDDILSTYWMRGRSDSYAYLAGTSMSAPHVAGAAAILLSLGLSPRQTVQRLLGTARDIGPPGRDSTFGHGRLDVAAAVRGLGPAAPQRSPAPAAEEPAPDGRPPGEEDEVEPAREREARAAPGSPEPGSGSDGAAGEARGRGSPVAPVAAGVIVLLLSGVVAWTLFRPSPEP